MPLLNAVFAPFFDGRSRVRKAVAFAKAGIAETSLGKSFRYRIGPLRLFFVFVAEGQLQYSGSFCLDPLLS